ncbi:Hsp20/alpha crystallin family protein [Opisthorchis viverrini]|uniref:Hsp20/alpha crystallin family protein n=1 Tax=Opisthorchis viverrini TaxID=6198 RepID=A0A1S8WZV6_OPIVI|nr:Hsp20/alpha crystallin family protein [Opisthorchis viverrini]
MGRRNSRPLERRNEAPSGRNAPLVPTNLLGVSPSDFFESYGDVHSVINGMDYQQRALTQHMEQEPSQAAPTEGEGYGPDDNKVYTFDDGVTVHAKKFVQNNRALSSREYSRTIYIPKSVDKNQLKCHFTEDGVLMLEAPVKTADYKSITFDNDRQISIKLHSETEAGQKRKSEDAFAIQPTGVLGPTVLKDDKSGGDKLHVENPVDLEFTADVLCVRMDANRIVVSGKGKTVDKTGNSSSTLIKGFSRSYDVPRTG